MSTLYLVRHGQACFGSERYDQLSPLGQRQAAAAGAYLASRALSFHDIYCGPRRRHWETLRIMLGECAQTATPLETRGLDEFADAEQILSSAERHFGVSVHSDPSLSPARRLSLYGSMLSAWVNGNGVIDGSPSVAEFRDSVRSWLTQHRRSSPSGRCTLAVTSAGTIAVVLCEVLDLPVERMLQFASVINNASITEVVYTPERISLRSFNTSSHLAPDLLTAL